MAPCPICSPNSPKFLHGGFLVWYPDEGVIRAIGPECGDTVLGGTLYAEALRDLELREHEEACVEFLRRNHHKLLQMVLALNAIRPATIEADRLYREFVRKAPAIQKELRKINRAGGGTLKVTIVNERGEDEERPRGPRGFGKQDSDYDSHDAVIGQLPDSTLFLTRFDPIDERLAIEAHLSDIPDFISEYETFCWGCDLTENIAKLEAACATFRVATELYGRLSDRLDRVAAFFSDELFALLDAWGQHGANEFDLVAERDGSVYRLRHGRTGRDREEVSLNPNLDKLLVRLPWPELE